MLAVAVEGELRGHRAHQFPYRKSGGTTPARRVTGKNPAHLSDGSALNMDGTWKHGGTTLTRKQAAWLKQHGWVMPQ